MTLYPQIFLQIFLRLCPLFSYPFSMDIPMIILRYPSDFARPTRGNAAYGVAGAAFSHVSEMDRRLRQRAATGIWAGHGG